jgi:hypothetical protein
MNGKRMYDIKIVSYPFEKGAWFKGREESIWG